MGNKSHAPCISVNIEKNVEMLLQKHMKSNKQIMYWIKKKDLVPKLYLGMVEGLLDGKSRGEHKAVSSRKTMTGSRLVYTTLRVKIFFSC